MKYTFTLIVLLFSLSAPTFAQTTPPQITAVEQRILAAIKADGIPGLSAAVAIGDKLKWTRGFGLADIEHNVAVTDATMFRLASISKPITAIAAMQLWEAGKLPLDADVRSLTPAFPEKPWPITVRQLLCHQGGIRHYSSPGEIDSARHYDDMLGGLDFFRNDPLVAEPGTAYHYSTYGYVLLGAAVEKAAGRPFMELVRDKVAIPAKADGLRADDSRAIIPHRARGYVKQADGQLRNCNLADTSNKIAGGGMIARPRDLVNISLALLRDELMKPQTRAQMWTAQKTRDGKPTEYALGWRIRQSDNLTLIAHSGGQQGTSTILVLVPEKKVVVALMCNLEKVKIAELGHELALLLSRD